MSEEDNSTLDIPKFIGSLVVAIGMICGGISLWVGIPILLIACTFKIRRR